MYSNPTFLMSTVKHSLYHKHTTSTPTLDDWLLLRSQFIRSGPQISLAKILSGCGKDFLAKQSIYNVSPRSSCILGLVGGDGWLTVS